ncbi:MAG: amino acid ABC transporter permease [Neisseria sp.]|nr:amino acid ABC transporter permease [Neisseria sp.]
MNLRFDILYEYRYMFLHGALTTLWLTAVSVVIGMVLGLFGALGRLAHSEKGGAPVQILLWMIRQVTLAYVTFFRGTPLFVQIFIWYFVWFAAMINPTDGWLISGEAAVTIRQQYGVLIAGILALSVNAGAYMTEIFRAGIQSIDKGQVEAARSLGLSYKQTMRHIVLPQAMRRMLPPFGNEFITLLKDSSLLSAIAVAELAFVARTISGRYFIYESPYYAVAFIYLIMTVALTWFFSWLEKRYNSETR